MPIPAASDGRGATNPGSPVSLDVENGLGRPEGPFRLSGPVEVHQWDTARKRMGAASELRAAAHLLAQGYDVYRSVADHATFDMIAHRNGELIRVEVKTVSKPKAEHNLPPFGWPVNDDWDLLLIVAPDVVFQFWAGSATRDSAGDAIREHYGLPIADRSLVGRVQVLLVSSPDQEWTAGAVAVELRIARRLASTALIRLSREGLVQRVRDGVYRARRWSGPPEALDLPLRPPRLNRGETP